MLLRRISFDHFRMARQGQRRSCEKESIQRRPDRRGIIAILKESEAGVETGALCRRHGIARACFYRWKSKFGGLELSEARRLRRLEGGIGPRRAGCEPSATRAAIARSIRLASCLSCSTML